jgi:uncharacterized membrane protein
MTFYELFLFVHVAATVIWVGAGFLLLVLGLIASRTDDDDQLQRILADNEALATRLFIPASLTVLAAGVVLMIDGSWSFDHLWLVIGLIGYLATFATGVFLLKPHGERIHAMTQRAGGMTAAARAETRRLLTLGRIDTVVLFLVIFDMVVKPTGDDVAVLVVMGAIVVLGVGWSVARARAIPVPAEAGAA